jgi:hypothetical protein
MIHVMSRRGFHAKVSGSVPWMDSCVLLLSIVQISYARFEISLVCVSKIHQLAFGMLVLSQKRRSLSSRKCILLLLGFHRRVLKCRFVLKLHVVREL